MSSPSETCTTTGRVRFWNLRGDNQVGVPPVGSAIACLLAAGQLTSGSMWQLANGGGVSERVAVVSTVDPYPSDTGKKVVIAGFLEYLKDRLGPRNVHYVIVGGPAIVDVPVVLHRIP